jgi:MFS family permease
MSQLMSDKTVIDRNIRNVIVLATCQALFNSGRTLTFITASLVAISMLNGNFTFVTAPITMMLVGTSVGSLPAAFIMKNLGRKWGFFVGSVVGTLGSMLAAYSISIDNFLLFNFSIFIFGLYGGAAQQYRFAAADVAPENIKAKSVSIVIAMGVIGGIIGPETVILTKNSLSQIPFEGTFWVLSLLCLLSAIIILAVDIPNLTLEEFTDIGRPLTKIIANHTFIVALIAALFSYATMNLLMTATPVTMRIEVFTDENIARVIQWHVIGMFAPGFFTGSIIRRFGVVRIIFVGTILLLFAVLIALSGNSFSHFFLSLLFMGIGWNFAFTGGTLLLTEVHSPSERAKVQGFNDFILFTGLAMSSLFAGIIYHFMGWYWVNLATAPMILSVMISAIWLRRIRKRNSHVTQGN